MNNARVTGLRSVELGVTNLTQSAAFYSQVWGLEPVVSDGDTIHLRGNGTEHHAVTLRERPTAGPAGRALRRREPRGGRRAARAAKARASPSTAAPAELPASAGGGYGFQFRTPEGHVLNISSDVARHQNANNDRSVPNKLSHVVLNSAKIEQQTSFFIDTLGFKLSDKTDMMDFVRCSADHHSIAMARGNGPTLNHWPIEVAEHRRPDARRRPDEEARLQCRMGHRPPRPRRQRVQLFRRAERLRGRIHRRGRSRSTRRPTRRTTPTTGASFPMRPCRWGMAGMPSNRFKAAASGDLSVADPEAGKRCEEIMAQTLGR